MKCMKARNILSIAATFGMLVSYCSFEGLSGGTTTETTNGRVTGLLETSDGSPATQTIVTLIESNYDPVKDGPVPDSLVDTTGEAGEFAFHIAGGGTFNIQGVRHSSGEGILISGVTVKDSNTTTIPPGTIRKTGSIKILLPPNIDTADAYIYIRGTTICAMLDDTSGFALLESVPAGIIPSVYYAVTSSAAGPKTIADSVSVTPGVTTVIGYQTGAHSAKLVFNTTASGADITGNVMDFPALVRLTSENFDFSQAKSGGEDIRFTKADGTPMAFEIEHWDALGQTAEIWVKVDTVYSNDSTQHIDLYWGNPDAMDKSNGAAVFDTAKGFQGVWHLNRKFDDATYDGNNGTNYGATDTTGIIGYCKKFDGSDSIKIAGLLGSPASITMSAWAQLDSSFGNGSEVVSIGDAAFIRLDYPANNLGTSGAVHLSDNDSVFAHVGSGKYLKQTGWHFITITHSETAFATTVYIDGVIAGVRTDPNKPINYSGMGQNTCIGKHGNGKTGYDFYGKIDEVRVYREAVSADYIRLCYMNQRQDDRLVVFK